MRMLITDTKVIDIDDIRMLYLGNQFVFLQEPIECTDVVRYIGQLLQNLEYDLDARRLSLREVN